MKQLGKTWSLTLALALAGCATAPDSSRDGLAPGSRYVAMGSSFAAGAGIGPTKPGTPARCQRTAINYATLLAQRLSLDLTDVTCGGATTAHILGPWNELPPQIEAVTPDTRLVTISVGSNDLRYIPGLMGASCRAGVPFQGRPCWPMLAPTDEDYRKLEANMREIARQVRARAPQARLVFVQYVTLVPATPCDAARLPPEDAATSRTTALRLAEITARAAQEVGATVLAADEMSRDHTPCSATPWSNGMSAGYDSSRGAPWHPNRAGHAAIAEALAQRLAG